MKNRRFRIGAVTTGITVFFIAAIILFNLFVGVLADRYYWKWDMTMGGLYDITEDTVNYVGSLDEPVEMIVLATEEAYLARYSVIGEILKKYAAYGGDMLSLRFINPEISTAALEKYNALGTLSDYDVIVSSDRRFKVIRSYDMLQTQVNEQTYETSLVGYQAEQKLTSALMYVSNEAVPLAMFTDGHGERPLSALGSLLENNNYVTDRLNLTVDEIADDVSLLIVSAPTLDFLPAEVEKLDAFFGRGGNMWVFYDVNTPKLTVLERYLAEWGMAFRSEVVLDNVSALGNQLYVVPEFGAHEIISQMSSSNMPSLIVGARPIDLPVGSSRTVTPLIKTSKNSYTKDFTNGAQPESLEKTDSDTAGPFVVGALSEQSEYDNAAKVLIVSRVFATSVSFTVDDMISTSGSASVASSLLNLRFMNSVAKYFNPSNDNVSIEPKLLPGSVLNLPIGIGMVLICVIVVILPLLVFGAGLAVWLRRRHL